MPIQYRKKSPNLNTITGAFAKADEKLYRNRSSTSVTQDTKSEHSLVEGHDQKLQNALGDVTKGPLRTRVNKHNRQPGY